MKIEHHLSDKQKKQLNEIKKQEKLSRRDLEDLMGTKRDTFKRVRGAVRRK